MDISPESANAVLSELRTIRWLLIIIAAVGLLLVGALFAISRAIGSASKVVQKKNEQDVLQTELEQLLSSGQAREAKFGAIEWIARQPRHAQGHWVLAKAHYELGELIEAKKVFQTLLKISPDWEFSINPWLARIEEEIQASGPRVVK
jgi:cytochrome c-type biogenesis protein CcmH/NrfG